MRSAETVVGARRGVSGKGCRRKGSRAELKVKDAFREAGIPAKKVPLSGGTDFQKGDVVLTVGRRKLVVEVKARKEHPALLARWLKDADLLILQADRKQNLVVLSQDLFLALIGKTEE